MRLLYILLYSILFSSSVFAKDYLYYFPDCVDNGTVFYGKYTSNDYIYRFHSTSDCTYDINTEDNNNLNITETTKYIDGSTAYSLYDTGSDDNIGDYRYYFSYSRDDDEFFCDNYFDSSSEACVDSCPSGSSPDANNICVPSECSPISDYPVPLEKEDCINGADFSDFDKGVSGLLTWQDCDETCYITEFNFISCNDALNKFNSLCDPDLNNFNFNCVEPDNGDSSYTMSHSCIPKNQLSIKSPCDEVYQDKVDTCKEDGATVIGKCVDNGMIVTLNTLDCEILPPDCQSAWHEVLNDDRTKCVCEDGYEVNSFGDCWKPLITPPDENTTLTPDQENLNTKAELDNHLAKISSTEKDSDNDNIDTSSLDLSTTNDTLAGIRQDLNITNNLLNSIKDTFNSSVSAVVPPEMTDSQNKISDLFDIVSNGFNGIKSDYDSALGKVQNGFSISPASSGVSPIFETEVFNTTLKIDLCESLHIFYPIGYYLFSLVFVLIGLRIFFFSFVINI